MTLFKKLCIGIFVLIILTPLGLILPRYFKAEGAWGEWGHGQIQKFIGYVPQGFKKSSGFWNAPMPDYSFKGWGSKGMIHLSVAYIVAAVLGAVIISGIVFLLGKMMAKNND